MQNYIVIKKSKVTKIKKNYHIHQITHVSIKSRRKIVPKTFLIYLILQNEKLNKYILYLLPHTS